MSSLVRVLLVEDDAAYSAFVSDALADAGFQITSAGSLRGALDHLRGHAYSVVLLDLHLPDSDGIETLRRIHAAAADAPVIVLSGVFDQDLAMATLQAGAQDYLLKQDIHPSVIASRA